VLLVLVLIYCLGPEKWFKTTCLAQGKKWKGEIGFASLLPSSGFLVQASHEFILKIIYYGTCSVFAFVRVCGAKSQNFLIALFSESLFATFQLVPHSGFCSTETRTCFYFPLMI